MCRALKARAAFSMAVVGVLVAVTPGRSAASIELIARLAGTGAMAADVAGHANDLLGLSAGVTVAALETVTGGADGQNAQRRRWDRTGATTVAAWPEKQPWDAGSCFLWQVGEVRSDQVGVVLMGHGVPPRWSGGPAEGEWRLGSAGAGPSDAIGARDLAHRLKSALEGAGRPAADLLVLEACNGATLEVLWELADSARLVVAVPGEVTSPGIQYRPMDGTATVVARRLIAAQGTDPEASRGPAWSLTICETARLDDLVSALRQVSQAARKDMTAFCAAARRAQARAALGEGLGWACDIGDLATGLRAYANTGKLAEAADGLARATRHAVIGREVVGQLPVDAAEAMEQRIGICIGLPPPTAGDVRGYAGGSWVARETGWGDVVREYIAVSRAVSPFRS